MRKRNVRKRVGAILLAVTMTVSTLPQLSTTLHAAEQPSINQFATKEQLKTFNTDDTDGAKNPAKIYFGKDNQQWWIAGSQSENSLTLFAASPLAKDQEFESNDRDNKTDSSLWADCIYSEGTKITEVYPNHYGASLLRKILKKLETSNFTSAEQELMNDTTIYTEDIKNNTVYSTTDKLYLAYGEYFDDYDYITVGVNRSDNLNSGLRVDMDYWGKDKDDRFWLRTPGPYSDSHVLIVISNYYAIDESLSIGFDPIRENVVPAFELNLSSVVFASTASTALSEGSLQLQDVTQDGAFTLRYRGDDLGSATVSDDGKEIQVTDVSSDTYLVVQNSEGAYAKKITSETSVFDKDMRLDSFVNCKVWLEKTDTKNGMTYATLAKEGNLDNSNLNDNVTSSLPITNTAEEGDVANIQFVTKTQLKTFNTDDTGGSKNSAKLYFGKDNQQWWIVGSQSENSLTLFAASPLIANQVFEPIWDRNKIDLDSWELWKDCIYPEEITITEVYPNHYGLSLLRENLKELETSNFTSAEQELMNDTTIYTDDTKNNTVYSTTDKLYLAYGDDEESPIYITVGINSPDDLNGGLRVDRDYCGENGKRNMEEVWENLVWLRTPEKPNVDGTCGNLVKVFMPTFSINSYTESSIGDVSNGDGHTVLPGLEYAVVPAFELNLSSVIFASAVSQVSSEGSLQLQDVTQDGAFTLRYSGDDLGSATVSSDKSEVELEDISSGTYLVVQNSEGAYAKQITSETSISAKDMKLNSFSDCKVWLEKTDTESRMTYATLAKEGQANGIDVISIVMNNLPFILLICIAGIGLLSYVVIKRRIAC